MDAMATAVGFVECRIRRRQKPLGEPMFDARLSGSVRYSERAVCMTLTVSPLHSCQQLNMEETLRKWGTHHAGDVHGKGAHLAQHAIAQLARDPNRIDVF